MSGPQNPGLPGPPAAGDTALKPGTFDGEVVVVTGGGTGLGKAIASEFARLGASIVLASRKPEHLEAGEAAMSALGAPVLTVGCDIREPDSIAAAFDAAVERFGLPGVLINNAAANFPVPAEDMSPNAWRTVVDITLNGTRYSRQDSSMRSTSVSCALPSRSSGPTTGTTERRRGKGRRESRQRGRSGAEPQRATARCGARRATGEPAGLREPCRGAS